MTQFWHIDVFAEEPLTGNSLAVFLTGDGTLTDRQMEHLTQDMRQFESIFISQGDTARIFTSEEELPFAGHPLLGAAAILHHTQQAHDQHTSGIRLADRIVPVTTRRLGSLTYDATMDQGTAMFGATANSSQSRLLAEAFGLTADDLVDLPVQVVSTGLPYVILPVTADALARAVPTGRDANTVEELGAEFVYLVDVSAREGRTWDRAGLVEDVATGSAAGPVGAYLSRHGLLPSGEVLDLRQGRFVGRPSALHVQIQDDCVIVSGRVQVVISGTLLID